jgi:TetR/AcrR family transcriptional regulator, transcriptional repressor for nem operon
MPTQRELQKQQSREKILKSAATLFRKQGLAATGIDEIMEHAGLTAGAFYAHFKSKDDLIENMLWTVLPMKPDQPIHEFVPGYLTEFHRDHPQLGCPLATLGSELARAPKRLKNRISEKLNETILRRLPSITAANKKKALRSISMAVGALILARMTEGSELSAEFLNCYKD